MWKILQKALVYISMHQSGEKIKHLLRWIAPYFCIINHFKFWLGGSETFQIMHWRKVESLGN